MRVYCTNTFVSVHAYPTGHTQAIELQTLSFLLHVYPTGYTQIKSNHTIRNTVMGRLRASLGRLDYNRCWLDYSIAYATLRHQEKLDEINDAVKHLHEAECEEFTGSDAEQSFLLVLQPKQQSRWLQRYGNTITCMDATYKTLRYGFPCFFLYAKTG